MSLDVSLVAVRPTEVYERNITHNLTAMARAVGIYMHIWNPSDVNVRTAADMIEPLRKGLAVLRENPEAFKVYEPSNGWGSYDGLVEFVADYLAACEANPDAEVKAYG